MGICVGRRSPLGLDNDPHIPPQGPPILQRDPHQKLANFPYTSPGESQNCFASYRPASFFWTFWSFSWKIEINKIGNLTLCCKVPTLRQSIFQNIYKRGPKNLWEIAQKKFTGYVLKILILRFVETLVPVYEYETLWSLDT